MKKKMFPARRLYNAGLKGLMYLSAALTGALVLFLLIFVLAKGLPLSLIHI